MQDSEINKQFHTAGNPAMDTSQQLQGKEASANDLLHKGDTGVGGG